MLPPGAVFGADEIVRLIGRGGMGEVYEAVDPSLLPNVQQMRAMTTWVAEKLKARLSSPAT